MDVETANLPTSSRPPPAGQDAVEFVEGEIQKMDLQGSKDLCYDTSKTLMGTPKTISCQNPVETSHKMLHVQQNFASNEAYSPTGLESSSQSCSEYFYENWRNNFETLVYDAEGRHVFYDYLTREKHAILLDCLGACEVFRTLPPQNDLYISARDFYKRFIQFRNPKLPIRDQTRAQVNQWMRNSSLHNSMFEEVELDVFNVLKNTWYDRFMSSDFFLNYCLSANQIREQDRKAFVASSKGLGMPTVMEESTGDLGESTGAHGKEIKGKSMKLTDELRRPPQDTAAPSHMADPSQLGAKSLSDLGEVTSVQQVETGSRTSTAMASDTASSKRERQKNKEREDNLPTLPHFKPRTERINREAMKPMKPEDFARILCEKLEKVIHDREQAEKGIRDTPGPSMDVVKQAVRPVGDEQAYKTSQSGKSQPIVHGDDAATIKSHSSYPQSDRYSVAGMSSASGSEVKSDSQLKYRHGAKELASAVHHALRTELKECRCQQCLETQIARKLDAQTHVPVGHDHGLAQNTHCSCCKHLQHDPSMQQRTHAAAKLTPSTLGTLKNPPPVVDHQRIYSWMEHNERYRTEMLNPHVLESPQQTPTMKRRHRQPVVYDTSRPVDCGPGCLDHHYVQDPRLPVVPQPDTSSVLEEAKRRLEDNTRAMGKSSRRSGRSSHRSHQPYMDPGYAETALSTTSGNWTLSDSASSVSRNQVPSVISSIPSSASQFINESASDVQSDSVRSHGSGNSKGHRKDRTTVTYFLGLEPIPYRTSLPGKNINLGQFKQLITKKGTFRYFFKTKTRDDGIVYQQIEDDDDYLPKFENKIVVKVEKVE